jgi:DNA-directed RNA polymerase subunit RPC12/RpoP
MANQDGKRVFPCPVCMEPREVRQTKKDKPYITCDPCGIQLFIRGPVGIAAFNRLVDHANHEGLWEKLSEMEGRYRLKCPDCGTRFWIEPELIETSIFDGSIKGFRCPKKECEATVKWESEQ